MQIKVTQTDGRSVVMIAGDLRIGSVANAKPDLVAVLAIGTAIQLDLAKLGECDTAGLQLLLMACASARAKGQGFATIGHTDAFRTALDRAGIPVQCLECAHAARDNGHANADHQ
jgi:anti-anti-sigma regulatory factor